MFSCDLHRYALISHVHACTCTDPREIVTCVVCVHYTQIHPLTCECVHSCVCAEVIGWHQESFFVLCTIFETRSHWTGSFMTCLDWLASKLRNLPVSASLAVGLQTYRHTPSHPVFMQVYRLQTHTIMPSFCASIGDSKSRLLCLYSKCFKHWAIFPVLDFDFQPKQNTTQVILIQVIPLHHLRATFLFLLPWFSR